MGFGHDFLRTAFMTVIPDDTKRRSGMTNDLLGVSGEDYHPARRKSRQ
jgi:hypothetical protein